MKLLKLVLTTVSLYVLLFATGSQFSSCKKTVTVYDTVTVILKDTVTVIDSTVNIRTGMVAWYTFTNGSLADSSGNNNTIFLNNNAVKTTDRFGNANNAYLFDGATSYMQVKKQRQPEPGQNFHHGDR